MNTTQITSIHQPVLLDEAILALNVVPNKWYLDGTFGRGGHTKAILAKGGLVLAFDVDHQAIAYAEEALASEISKGKLLLVRENFDQLETVVTTLQAEGKIPSISGILFDFGTSADQLLDQERGFSFDSDTELDMRMDTRLGVTAKDLLAIVPEKQLAELFLIQGGEQHAYRIAKAIVRQRAVEPIKTTRQLAELITRMQPRHGRLHPATKVFQALRIAVNSELTSIDAVLPQALRVLDSGGRLVAISFHEGEDRIVKHFFKQQEKEGRLSLDELVTPTHQESTSNPRARSAKLRSASKITKK